MKKKNNGCCARDTYFEKKQNDHACTIMNLYEIKVLLGKGILLDVFKKLSKIRHLPTIETLLLILWFTTSKTSKVCFTFVNSCSYVQITTYAVARFPTLSRRRQPLAAQKTVLNRTHLIIIGEDKLYIIFGVHELSWVK